MLATLSLFPIAFWLTVIALVYFGFQAWRLRETAVGIPMLMVLATVAAWYVGDVLYNDYVEYIHTIGPAALTQAWWEVFLFVCTFGIFAPIIHRRYNRKLAGKKSYLLFLVRHGVKDATKLQTQIDVICPILIVCWAAIMIIALIRTDFDFQGLFMPYLGSKADPWSRGRIGAGFDSLIALAGYVLIGLTAVFGVFTAVATRPITRLLAFTAYFLALPTYIFDRTRNTMLATLLPGFCAWVFLRLRGGIIIRIIVLAVGFFVLEAWLKFVIANRSDLTIAAAFQQQISSNRSSDLKDVKHQGLNMFEELGHINSYITDGSYRPNWGARYFAELVNPVPRVLWPGKPLDGLDYAVARGLAYADAADNQGGVGASVSTGMIGQGVVNFGRYLGPIAAALIMCWWVAKLAQQDLRGDETGRLLIYPLGLFLTFNMGRDITLLVMYPFWIGYLVIIIIKYWNSNNQPRIAASSASGPANRANQKRRPAAALDGALHQQGISPRLPGKVNVTGPRKIRPGRPIR